MRVSILSLTLLLCSACGNQISTGFTGEPAPAVTASTQVVGDDAAPDMTEVHGSVDGNTLAPRSAIFVPANDANGWPYVGVVIADVQNLCAAVSAGKLPSNMNTLAFTLNSSAPGTYNIASDTAAGTALAAFSRSDATCHNTLDERTSAAQGGQVTISTAPAGEQLLRGVFSVVIGGGSDAHTVSGTFVAVPCAEALAMFNCANQLNCQ